MGGGWGVGGGGAWYLAGCLVTAAKPASSTALTLHPPTGATNPCVHPHLTHSLPRPHGRRTPGSCSGPLHDAVHPAPNAGGLPGGRGRRPTPSTRHGARRCGRYGQGLHPGPEPGGRPGVQCRPAAAARVQSAAAGERRGRGEWRGALWWAVIRVGVVDGFSSS